MSFQLSATLHEKRSDLWEMSKTVEKTEIVNHSVVPHDGDVNAGLVKSAPVGLAFIAQDVRLGGYDERWRQTF
jgi:hypothetical protein